MNTFRKPKGYILLLTLVLLSLVATVLTGVSLRSLERTIEVMHAQDELQQRWGAISCQSTLLPLAERVLCHEEQVTGQPCPTLRRSVTLGDTIFILVFADEQAKLNINAIYQKLGIEATSGLVQNLVQAAGSPQVIKLTPAFSPTGGWRALLPNFDSYGQVFQTDLPHFYISGTDRDVSSTRWLTCWGSGQLNFSRAPKQLIEALGPLGLDAASATALADERAQYPAMAVGPAMGALRLDPKIQEVGRRLLTDVSTCHSLWVIAATRNHYSYRFAVRDAARDGRNLLFTW